MSAVACGSMTPDTPFVIGQPSRCSGLYVMHWEASRFEVQLSQRFLGSRPVHCELVAAEGQPRNPLAVLCEPLPDDWRHHAGLRFDVTVDVTPLEEGSFGHRGWLRWRLRVDQWVGVVKVQNGRSSSSR